MFTFAKSLIMEWNNISTCYFGVLSTSLLSVMDFFLYLFFKVGVHYLLAILKGEEVIWNLS